jgi:hypothetical protein
VSGFEGSSILLKLSLLSELKLILRGQSHFMLERRQKKIGKDYKVAVEIDFLTGHASIYHSGSDTSSCPECSKGMLIEEYSS